MAKELDGWSLDGDDASSPVEALVDPREQDAYWQAEHARAPYFRAGLGYEDYAPAYCVGYIGYAQYRGTYEDAEKSLLANWLRIKGDSRLTLEEAQAAIRAAWDRVANRVPPRSPLRGPLPPEGAVAPWGGPAALNR